MANAEESACPRSVGGFEVLQEIGQGGMGAVYLAIQPALERSVVLKKIHRRLHIDPTMIARFQREARAAAAIHHQNVVAVYDCFSAQGDYYIAQEYVDGENLQFLLRQVRKIPARIAALIGLELIRGLEEIHSRGIVHRGAMPEVYAATIRDINGFARSL